MHLLEERGQMGRYAIDSAGLGTWHQGDPPDSRSVHVAALHGIDISQQRARKIDMRDFDRFDLILGMDKNHVSAMKGLASTHLRPKIHLFSEYAEGTGRDVPDPYYGGPESFAEVYNMLFSGCEKLLDRLLEV